MLQNFIFVFFLALFVELIRQKLLPFTKFITVNKKQSAQPARREEEMSETEREIEQVKRELQEMVKEADKYNNPEQYTKYAKMQRQIIQKQKVLQIMQTDLQKEQADQNQKPV